MIPEIHNITDIGDLDFKAGAVCLIDKEKTWTSFDVVNKLRSSLRHKYKQKKFKVGHAGTLDPMATGLLLICTGKGTKQIDSYQGMDKTYIGELTLGGSTPSYDAETEVDQEYSWEHISEDLILQNLELFKGEQLQEPPMFSALKKNGVPLYKLARQGKSVAREKRKINIRNLEITNISLPKVEFAMTCTKGTYVRSFAHDYGHALDSGAHLTALRRTHIGDYDVANAQVVQLLVDQINKTYDYVG